MKILESIINFFCNKRPSKNNIDILISLNNNFEIDMSVCVNNSLLLLETGPLLVSEFLNIINSGKLKNQIIEMIADEIKNDYKNTEFMDKLSIYNNMIDQINNDNLNQHDIFIKPSSVFSKNSI